MGRPYARAELPAPRRRPGLALKRERHPGRRRDGPPRPAQTRGAARLRARNRLGMVGDTTAPPAGPTPGHRPPVAAQLAGAEAATQGLRRARCAPCGAIGLCGQAQALVAQLAVPVEPLVCLEAIVGDDSLPSAGVWASLRLLVSPVKPSLTQVGAPELVVVRAVCASSDVLVPKNASPPPASPNTPHSVVFQFAARSISL